MRDALEPIEKPFEIIEFFVGTRLLRRAAADLFKDLAGAAVDILALGEFLVGADTPVTASLAAERVAGAVGVRFSQSLPLLARLLLALLSHLVGEVAHALTERLYGFGLPVKRAGEILLTQRLLGPVHRVPGPAEILARRVAFGRAGTGQVLGLTAELLAQGALAIGQILLQALPRPGLTRLLALALPLAKLLFAVPALALLTGLLTLALLTLLPLLTLLLALLALLARIELLLQIAERLVGKLLLLAQGLGEALHRLLTRALLTLTGALRDLHVLHHLAKLFEKPLRLLHAALLHQLLKLLQHVVELTLGHLLHFALLGLLVRVLLRLFRELAHVIVHRLAKLLHELGDFLVSRAVLHRLRETLLCPAEPLERIREIALLHEKRDVPQDRRHFVAGLFGQRAIIRRRLEAADQDAELEVGRLLGEHLLGLVGDRPQHRGHPGGIVARPQKIAALFHDGLRERVEESPAGHLLFDRAGRAHLLFR